MTAWQGYLQNEYDLYRAHSVPASYVGGHSIGIIAIDLVYPKLPGNVVNATTFSYPVLYKKVSFDIELLFRGDPQLGETIVNAAKELEADGVRAVIGACGYFAHFQKQVAAEVNIPVFMSSLCQVHTIKLGLKPEQKILVLCADGANATADVFGKVGADYNDCVILDVGNLESFASIRHGKTTIDNKHLAKNLADAAQKSAAEYNIGAILLECSDLPPYACDIQRATGLPVFDFISLINWAHHASAQRRYFGYF